MRKNRVRISNKTIPIIMVKEQYFSKYNAAFGWLDVFDVGSSMSI